jgi:hypothetical protein
VRQANLDGIDVPGGDLDHGNRVLMNGRNPF